MPLLIKIPSKYSVLQYIFKQLSMQGLQEWYWLVRISISRFIEHGKTKCSMVVTRPQNGTVYDL